MAVSRFYILHKIFLQIMKLNLFQLLSKEHEIGVYFCFFLHQPFEDILVPKNFAHSQECPSLENRGKIHPIRLVDLVGKDVVVVRRKGRRSGKQRVVCRNSQICIFMQSLRISQKQQLSQKCHNSIKLKAFVDGSVLSVSPSVIFKRTTTPAVPKRRSRGCHIQVYGMVLLILTCYRG